MKVVKIVVPPDKSISQRAIMLASISEGITRIKNLLMGDDCLRAIDAFRAMGVKIASASTSSRPRNDKHGVITSEAKQSQNIVIHGAGMRGLKKPAKALFLGNSGTAMRILPGILAGQDFEVALKGDKSLSKRPMGRIAEPLRKMGVEIASAASQLRNDKRCVIASEAKQSREIYPPLKIKGGKLKAIKYVSKIASAQVKSCVLLAGLYADGVTSVTEPVKSRDHTERMLKIFGSRLKVQGCRVALRGPVRLKSPGRVLIPGDISSAAFFIVAGCILPGIKVVLKNVGMNPTRTGIIDILKKMGADIKVTNLSLRGRAKRRRSNLKKRDCFAPLAMTMSHGEPNGDIIVKSSKLKGAVISPHDVVGAIDEIPIIMVAACFAKGITVIKGIGELRVKETDRVRSMVTNLRKMGADVKPLTLTLSPKGRGKSGHLSLLGREKGEGLVINGGRPLHGAAVSSFGDHRTAMSMLVAGLAVKGVRVHGLGCINKSFPGFERLLRAFGPRNDKKIPQTRIAI